MYRVYTNVKRFGLCISKKASFDWGLQLHSVGRIGGGGKQKKYQHDPNLGGWSENFLGSSRRFLVERADFFLGVQVISYTCGYFITAADNIIKRTDCLSLIICKK